MYIYISYIYIFVIGKRYNEKRPVVNRDTKKIEERESSERNGANAYDAV